MIWASIEHDCDDTDHHFATAVHAERTHCQWAEAVIGETVQGH
jgi:hypothetical protein